jgi:transposase-like protein
MAWLRRWWRRHRDTTEEALAVLAAAEEREEHVRRLGRALARIQAENHFSAMVSAAIARAREV